MLPAFVLRAIEEGVSLQEILKEHNIYLAFAKLSGRVHGLTYADSSGYYLIIINENLSITAQYKTLLHELKHIIYDLPKMKYIVGKDMNSNIEKEADKIAEEWFKEIVKKLRKG